MSTPTEQTVAVTERIDAAAKELGAAYAELITLGEKMIAGAYSLGGRSQAENLSGTASNPAIAREVATLLYGHGLARVMESQEARNHAPITAMAPRWSRMVASGLLTVHERKTA